MREMEKLDNWISLTDIHAISCYGQPSLSHRYTCFAGIWKSVSKKTNKQEQTSLE